MMIWLLFGSANAYCQTNPQYEFYFNYDVSALTGGIENCVHEARSIEHTLKLYDILYKDSLSENEKFLAQMYAALIICYSSKGQLESAADLESLFYKVACLTDRQRIDLLVRLYNIEKNCYIRYTTADGEMLGFKSVEDEDGGISVSFGASLVSNVREEEGVCCLKFGSPVTEIDASIFAENVSSIVLPISKNLRYLSNTRKDVYALEHIEGYDVKDHQSLIDKDSVLVVAAVAGLSEFSVPSCVRILGEDCFRNSKLERVVVPTSVTSIKSGAFDKCANLKEVILEGEQVISFEENAFFEDTLESLKIYVPKKVLKQYRKKYPLLKKRFSAIVLQSSTRTF